MISLHGQATRGAFPMSTTTSHSFIIRFSPFAKSFLVQIRVYRMLSRNQSQRHKGIKVKVGIRTWLALAVCVWMIYQLRVFLNHKLSSENGWSMEEDDHSEKLKLGRKGLLVMGSEVRKIDEGEESRAEAMEEVKGKKLQEIQQEMEDKEEVGRGGDFDDEELDSVRFDDPMDEIDSLNDDDDDEDDDDDASNDQHGEEEDDSPLERLHTDKVAVATRIS